MTLPRILAIGGSDSGGGAGIEADIKTITVLGGYAMTAITAVTAQDTMSIQALAPVPPHVVNLAIRMVIADLGVDAVKIGMLGSTSMVDAVVGALARGPDVLPIVLDPVLASTSGTALLDETATTAMLRDLMPIVALITPNRHEAATLAGVPVATHAEAIVAARILCERGARAVLVKGGHFEGNDVVDHLVTRDLVTSFRKSRIETRHTHGTGCTLASAVAVGLGCGLSLSDAIGCAQDFLQKALRAAPGFGAGHGPMGHAAAMKLSIPPA
ncbi:MAG: bifunctional hydroxymethylpyrimidine kinase/phosphomethylpyrimidine kinase [Acidiphilium sp.]|nr:bifunctional hydroxymethylpyrimidine kinase/phosphomethylpyrimidine kinase [Acidiphilium sp.]MDD4934778.1 bifunctional hydroxymethylpyrimidine kinase/phosphomethylpyrimidine kinase [Acidiphilium sp.]